MPTVNLAVTRSPHVAGGMRVVTGSYTGPASYATNGDTLGPGDIGLGDIEFIQFNPASPYTVSYNYTTGKAQWYVAAGTEATAATVLSGVSCRFWAVGK